MILLPYSIPHIQCVTYIILQYTSGQSAAGNSPDMMPVLCRATIYISGQFRVASWPKPQVLGLWKKTGISGGNPTHANCTQKDTLGLSRNRTQDLLLWGNSANHWTAFLSDTSVFYSKSYLLRKEQKSRALALYML